MASLIVRALLAALVNEKVVDRLLAILDHAIKRRNDEQTVVLRAEVEALHRQNMQRFENVEHGLARLGVKVRNLERAVFADESELEEVREIVKELRATDPFLTDNSPDREP